MDDCHWLQVMKRADRESNEMSRIAGYTIYAQQLTQFLSRACQPLFQYTTAAEWTALQNHEKSLRGQKQHDFGTVN
eukprot:4552137-Amphidinium_carterae.2